MRLLLVSAFVLACCALEAKAAAQTPEIAAPSIARVCEGATPIAYETDKIVVASGEVKSEGVIASIPYKYCKTGVAAADVRHRGFFGLGDVLIPAGTPGFWVGVFNVVGPSDVWCFVFFEGGVERANPVCLALGRGASILVGNPEGYVMSVVSFNVMQADFAEPVQIDEREVTFDADLTLSYILRKTKRGSFDIAKRALGRGFNFSVKRDENGVGTLEKAGLRVALKEGSEKNSATVSIMDAPRE